MHQYRAFSRIQCGERHIKTGKGCQDFALATDAAPNCSVIVAADGHGGADYFRSDRGARFAVQAAAATLMEFAAEMPVANLRDLAGRQDLLRALFEGILSRWHEEIAADLFDDPFEASQMEQVNPALRTQYLAGQGVERAYGTTLIAALVTEKYFLGLQQGDGRCVAVRTDGSCEQPIAWDERCQGNLTTSMCDAQAAEQFRHCFTEQLPAAVFLCTDGVDSAYPDMDGVYGLCQALGAVYLSDGRPGLERVVAEYLPMLSRRGNGDDVTIAGLLCVDKLMPVAEVLHLEERLRKTSVLWDQAGAGCHAHEHALGQQRHALEDARAAVTQLEGLIDRHARELAQDTERLHALEEAIAKQREQLDALAAKLEEARTREQEADEKAQWMEREHTGLQQHLNEITAEVERLMDASDRARTLAAQQRRAQEPSEHEGEDYTEPWAFVNRRSEQAEEPQSGLGS